MTKRDRYLSETVVGTDRAARKKAEEALTRPQADADRHRVPDTFVPLRQALAEWLATVRKLSRGAACRLVSARGRSPGCR